jgi:hypothetical protein
MQNIVELMVGESRMRINAAQGAWIVEFSLNGKNVLVGSGLQIGSTFWPSPQSLWNWPPPAEIDSEPYAVTHRGGEFIFDGPRCSSLGLRVRKIFSVDTTGGAVDIRYGICNIGDSPMNVAHWEVTRVHGGLTFYSADGERLEQSTDLAGDRCGVLRLVSIPAGTIAGILEAFSEQ